MKKIKFLLIVLLNIVAINMNAQKTPNIVGVYNLGSSSPEGGSSLIVLENGNFAIMFFGGYKVGKWKYIAQDRFEFTPNAKENQFEIYGRYNKELKDSTKIFFSGFSEGTAFLQLKTEQGEKHMLQRVFNSGANCWSFPYVKTFNKKAKYISFMSQNHYTGNSDVITFDNSEGFNDFTVEFTAQDYSAGKSFEASFKKNKLFLSEEDSFERQDFESVNEDFSIIDKLFEMEEPKDYMYLNPSYALFGSLESDWEGMDITKTHRFDENKNAYLAPFYKEGDENDNSDYSYENMAFVLAYKALKEFTKDSKPVKIKEGSIFTVNCH